MATTFASVLNNASTTLSAPYISGLGAIKIAPGDGAKFPVLIGSNYYRVTILRAGMAYNPSVTPNDFTIYQMVPAASPVDTLILQATLETTIDRPYSIGDIVQARITSGTLSDIHHAINAVENIPNITTGSGPPVSTPIDGTLYIDTTNKVIYFRGGGAWNTVAAPISEFVPSTYEQVGGL